MSALEVVVPTSGSARRRAKAERNRRNVGAIACARDGHQVHPFLERLCTRCGRSDL